MREIIIDIDENAEVTVSVKGVRGKGCKALTKAVEQALGTVVDTKFTKEATMTEGASNAHRANN